MSLSVPSSNASANIIPAVTAQTPTIPPTTLPLPPLVKERIEDPNIYSLAISTTGKDKAITDLYEKCVALFWIPASIMREVEKDNRDWAEFAVDIQHFLKLTLAFFAVSDGVVNESLSRIIMERVKLPEAQLFYRFQAMMEDIHNITYNLLVETYIRDPEERQKMLRAAIEYPTVAEKVNWIRRWIGSQNPTVGLDDNSIIAIRKLYDLYTKGITAAKILRPGAQVPLDPDISRLMTDLDGAMTPLATVILVNTITEGLFFSSSFCSIFWINHMYRKLPGLSKANEYISRDEGLHTEFGILMYRRLDYRLSQVDVYKIMDEAVQIESRFVESSLPKGLLNMNSTLMIQYVKFVADWLLMRLGYEKKYKTENPFDFMAKQSVGMRLTDFFIDADVTEYSVGGGKVIQSAGTRAKAHRREDF